jgi:hypothetical protein
MAGISQDEYERWLAGADKRDALARQRRARAAEREATRRGSSCATSAER